MRLLLALVPSVSLLALTACAPSGNAADVRAAVDSAALSLRDAVVVAHGDTGVGIAARLVVSAEPTFAVDALDESIALTLADVRIDTRDGRILSRQQTDATADACAGAVSLEDAIDAAESEVGGDAVSIELDDDGGCFREVMVLTDAGLMEAEVDESGTVVEIEAADDDELAGDDEEDGPDDALDGAGDDD